MEARIKYVDVDLRAVRDRLTVLIEIARWVWIVNAVVAFVGAYYGRYDITALAGFTWLLALVATAIGRRALTSLGIEPAPVVGPVEAGEGE